MPCFKGLAVSIHTPDGPLPEYAIQKQARANRISTYIPVPPAKVPEDSTSNIPELSTFAISITLLVPGLNVPYSTPKPSNDDPYPRPKVVGGLPGSLNERGQYGGSVGPYVPLTSSSNETIAAYIYFDGRSKEEVATLLRRGEETWVNSRWVSLPDNEGGGLAEREFLFREVGLERWLNGLDLLGQGKEVSEKIAKRRERLEKKRAAKKQSVGSDDEEDIRPSGIDLNGILAYGDDKKAPVQNVAPSENLSSDSESEDEPPMPEAGGQIKVALFRVLASGEIKRGEYSPQFKAHDDDDAMADQNGAQGDGNGDVDHTTSFAKPKALDPRSISTQTVTGMDPSDKPYATFTFLYRSERTLRKMSILKDPESDPKTPTTAAKRKSIPTDFSKLGPLNTFGIVGFNKYRDGDSSKNGKRKGDDDMDSDVEDDAETRQEDDDEEGNVKKEDRRFLSPEEAARQERLAEGLRQIKLKRAASAEPDGRNESAQSLKSPTEGNTTPHQDDTSPVPPPDPVLANIKGSRTASLSAADSIPEPVSSPYKRQRASLPGTVEPSRATVGEIGNVLGRIQDAEKQNEPQGGQSSAAPTGAAMALPEPNEDEDL
ncbi:MAG: hypothetical protein M1820_007392 [Bogoriella megaspora]|nr:MAG: hypothetical protein M1820_007392 [Bogoriella megaspora]